MILEAKNQFFRHLANSGNVLQGSEANFHKMLEIQEDCRLRYKEKLNKALIEVGGSLPEEPVEKIKEEDPEKTVDPTDDDLSKKLIQLLR
jgi:hypothetical protein